MTTQVNILVGQTLYEDVLYADFTNIKDKITILSKNIGRQLYEMKTLKNKGVFCYYKVHLKILNVKQYASFLQEEINNHNIPVTRLKDVKGVTHLTYNFDQMFENVVIVKHDYNVKYKNIMFEEDFRQSHLVENPDFYIRKPYDVHDVRSVQGKHTLQKSYMALRNNVTPPKAFVFLQGHFIKYNEQLFNKNKTVFSVHHRHLLRVTCETEHGILELNEKQVTDLFKGYVAEDSVKYTKEVAQGNTVTLTRKVNYHIEKLGVRY